MSKLDDVAREIEAAAVANGAPVDGDLLARAALLAIREPGEDVLQRVAIAACVPNGLGETCKKFDLCIIKDHCTNRARRSWEAGIDALLWGET